MVKQIFKRKDISFLEKCILVLFGLFWSTSCEGIAGGGDAQPVYGAPEPVFSSSTEQSSTTETSSDAQSSSMGGSSSSEAASSSVPEKSSSSDQTIVPGSSSAPSSSSIPLSSSSSINIEPQPLYGVQYSSSDIEPMPEYGVVQPLYGVETPIIEETSSSSEDK